MALERATRVRRYSKGSSGPSHLLSQDRGVCKLNHYMSMIMCGEIQDVRPTQVMQMMMVSREFHTLDFYQIYKM